MSIQIANNELSNCQSVEQVAELINEYYKSNDEGAELIAAKYAIDAAEEGGYGVDEDNLSAHLDFLADADASFDYKKALDLALKNK